MIQIVTEAILNRALIGSDVQVWIKRENEKEMLLHIANSQNSNLILKSPAQRAGDTFDAEPYTKITFMSAICFQRNCWVVYKQT